MRWLLLLILLFPLLEIYVFMEFGAAIGFFPTLFLTIGTALWGITMVRLQGIGTLNRMRKTLFKREVPALEMIEGSMLVVAGVMLLIPGFVTDSVGILLLIPPLRRALALKIFEKPSVVQFSAHSSQIEEDDFEPEENKSTKGRTIDQKEPWE